MFKRLLATVLTFSLVLPALTGCGLAALTVEAASSAKGASIVAAAASDAAVTDSAVTDAAPAPAAAEIAPLDASETEAEIDPEANSEAESGADFEAESGAEAVVDGTPYFVDQEPRTSPAWVRKLPAAKDPNVEQLIVVAGIDKTTAYVTMHERDMNGDWMQIIATPGFVGRDGIGKANINDAYTPAGTFTIDRAFGIAEDPGYLMPYTQVDDSYYWSGDGRKGKHFNELVSLKDVPGLDKKASEHIIDVEYGYRYCLNMGYNAECKYKDGFAFFMHCFLPDRPYTGGCVAVPESVMKFVMQHVRPGCKITINTLKKLGGKLDD